MPSRLPPETLDYIVDFLHDDLEGLEQCCLVSQSWVPRARKHLFSVIQFETPEDVEAWKAAFPNPSNSLAHYTRTLVVNCPEVVTAEDATDGGWLSSFSRVEYLILDNYPNPNNFHKFIQGGFKAPKASLAPYRKFAATLKRLVVISFVLQRSR